MRNAKHRATKTDRPIRRRVTTGLLATAAATTMGVGVSGQAHAAEDSTWNQLAQCESSGDWHINTGNGFYGGLQFTQETWEGYGGTEYASRADLAERWQQVAIAEKVLDGQGWGAWPACTAELGYGDAEASGTPDSIDGGSDSSGSDSGSDSSSGSGETYVVQSGDTLSKIAQAQGVDGGWRALWEANSDQVSDPTLIYVGEELQLP